MRCNGGAATRVRIVTDFPQADFFLSYATPDRPWARWIAGELEAAGYSVVIDIKDFRPGTSFVRGMENALANCRHTLAVVSDNYFNGNYTPAEWETAFAKDPQGIQRFLLPIRIAKCQLPEVLRRIVSIDLLDLDEAAARQALIEGVPSDGRERLGPAPFPGATSGASAGPSRYPGALPPIWKVPLRRNPNFTGREALLECLATSLQTGHAAAVTQAVHGLGGVGKTQLATEYIYRFLDRYDAVCWVAAESPTTLAAEYAGLAAKMNLQVDSTREQDAAIQQVHEWFDRHERWLLVFDNAEQAEDLKTYLPQNSTGHVVITSRNPNWRAVADPLKVEIWSREESVAFLIKRTGRAEPEAAHDLAKELGDLPLALAQAAGFIETRGLSLAEYVEFFRTRRRELWNREPPPDDYEKTVATTWNLSAESLNPEALQLLWICALLAPEEIPRWFFTNGADELPEPLRSVVRDDLIFRDCLAKLRSLALIETTNAGFSLHRLLQAVLRDGLVGEVYSKLLGHIVQFLAARFPFDEEDPQTWARGAELLPHVLAVRVHMETVSDKFGEARPLFTVAGMLLQTQGHYAEARSLLEQALDIGEQLYASDDPALAVSYANLALVERDLGHLDEARRLLQQALAIDEQSCTSDHTTLAVSYSNLATVERVLGHLEEARRLLQKTTAINEQSYAPNHPALAKSYSNLAVVEMDLGHPVTARHLLWKAIAIWEQAYTPDHPTLAVSYSNLALVEQKLGHLEEARRLLQKTIAINEDAYAPDHPKLATSYSNLALVELDLGHLEEARRLFRKALAIDEEAYAPDHPTLAARYNNLAYAEHDLGNGDAAREDMRRAYRIWLVKLGPEHPYTRVSARWLAEHDPNFHPESS